ncbi:hypothetical protein L6452_36826 [Arctium lappa]|uniref:Uncharacterized protein n=1 Tax=Arctium lappa TaxID=4217 RepID=A0ACB8Y1C9_ARCLA|nr:hypothetical protein L6452_36826 [Arctium lappa]
MGQQGVKVGGHGPWKNVGDAINNLLEIGTRFDDFCLKQLGNGQTTKFWMENWTESGLSKTSSRELMTWKEILEPRSLTDWGWTGTPGLEKGGERETIRPRWVKVIKAIDSPNGGLDMGQQGVKVGGHGPWKNVGDAINNLLEIGTRFDDFCLKQLGNGQTTKFWMENWTESGLSKTSSRELMTWKEILEPRSLTDWGWTGTPGLEKGGERGRETVEVGPDDGDSRLGRHYRLGR